MADRGRDLTLNLISDASAFDLAAPADELDALGRAAVDTAEQIETAGKRAGDAFDPIGAGAKDAARDLEQAGRAAGAAFDPIGAGAKDAAGDVQKAFKGTLEQVGDRAQAEGERVEKAFKEIAAASGKATKEVRQDFRTAESGLEEFRDEAGSTARESAASFSGSFSDAAGAIQEVAANALAGFGAVGAGLGLAAAAGLGILMSKLEEANARIQDVRENLTQMGRSADTTRLDKVNAALDTLREVGDLQGLTKGLTAAGVTLDDFLTAMVDGGPVADSVKGKLRDVGDTGQGLGQVLDGNVRAAQSAFDALDQYRQGAGLAAGDLAVMTTATKDLTEAEAAAAAQTEARTAVTEASAAAADRATAALQDAAAAADEHAEAAKRNAETFTATIETSLTGAAAAAGTFTERIQEEATKQAEATKDPKDSWEDYADTVELSTADVVKVLEQQTKAAERFRDNLLTVQKRGDEEFTAWVSAQPAQVAQAYVSGTAKQKGTIYAAFKANVGAQQGEGVAAGLTSKADAAADAAAGIHARVEGALSGSVTIPTQIGTPPPYGAGSAAAAEEAARRAIGTVTIPVRMQYVGAGSVRPVP
jgi:hypothetical protein